MPATAKIVYLLFTRAAKTQAYQLSLVMHLRRGDGTI
jgi:hypothetical protein